MITNDLFKRKKKYNSIELFAANLDVLSIMNQTRAEILRQWTLNQSNMNMNLTPLNLVPISAVQNHHIQSTYQWILQRQREFNEF